MKFYKPNPKVGGAACSFSVTSTGKAQGFYIQLVKQTGWDDKNKTGSFDKNPENKINLKFSPTEIAGMMEICQKKKGQAKFFHTTGDTSSQITFGVYPFKEGEALTPKGIALSVSKGEKKASVPFTFAEALLLCEWFRFGLNRIFVADYTEEKKLFKDKQDNS